MPAGVRASASASGVRRRRHDDGPSGRPGEGVRTGRAACVGPSERQRVTRTVTGVLVLDATFGSDGTNVAV